MAEVAARVLEWAAKETKNLEEADFEVDEEIAAEFLLSHVLQLLGDYFDGLTRPGDGEARLAVDSHLSRPRLSPP